MVSPRGYQRWPTIARAAADRHRHYVRAVCAPAVAAAVIFAAGGAPAPKLLHRMGDAGRRSIGGIYIIAALMMW
jgi:hypothetical protein